MASFTLKGLLFFAKAMFDSLSPEEQKAHRREQAIDFAHGQLACMKGGTYEPPTRERIAEIYDSMR